MNVLVVLANPKEACFTRDVAAIVADGAAANGHAVLVRDLYAMGFDPVATAEDIRGNLTGKVAPDVAEEQAHVLWSDAIVFVHPIWWIDRPAILKGWVDRVFALGFAYGYRPDGVAGSLAPRKAAIVTTSGSPQDHFDESGKMAAISTAQVLGTMEFCGLEMLGHLHFAPLGRRSTPEMVEGYKERVRAFVARHFGPVAAAGQAPRPTGAAANPG